MTGVRICGAVDRSILGVSSRLPGDYRCLRWRRDRLTHATQRVARRVTGRDGHPFEADEAAHVVDEVRHSDFAPRADDADGAHVPGSHAVLLIPEDMLDAGAHLRSRRIGGLLRLTEFAIAIGPAMNAAL